MTVSFQHIMAKATDEQKSIITDTSASAAIISCPGSGKTFTAALRMAHRLNNWESRCSGIALLSHTNVAISSFEEQFKQLGYIQPPRLPHFVGTLDGFITRFLISNFGHLIMQCRRPPTLISGSESFLGNQQQLNVQFAKKPSGQFPISVARLRVGLNDDATAYLFSTHGSGIILPKSPSDALKALAAMGKQGFYTHDHARYWGARILREVPKICEILAWRFPEIIVDEAQDTNPWQQSVLCQLEKAGTKLMLVGDPDQAIFEFGLGNATHLTQHKAKQGVDGRKLSKNMRSNQSIVTAAKSFGTADMSSDKVCGANWQGAYIVGYASNSECQAVETFHQHATKYGLAIENCAVIARSNDIVKKLRGDNSTFKDTTAHRFAKAALQRDYHKKPREAYEICKFLILGLCNASEKWKEIERNANAYEQRREFRRKLWNYVHDLQNGLPCSSLKAKTEWQPKLKSSLQKLCQDLSSLDGFIYPQNLGQNVPVTGLSDVPIIDSANAASTSHSIRIDSVHGVKGETLDAVLYVMTAAHLNPLIKRLGNDGSENELVKIGYVAMTRPRNLLWLAIPDDLLKKHRQVLMNSGFQMPDLTLESSITTAA